MKGRPVEIKIGVTHANRELTLESSQSVDDLQKALTEALSRDSGLIVLTDDRARTVLVPAGKLAYVEILGETGRRVGFGAV